MNISHEHEQIKLTSSPIFRFRDVWFIQINCFTSWNWMTRMFSIRWTNCHNSMHATFDSCMKAITSLEICLSSLDIWTEVVKVLREPANIVFLFYLLNFRTYPNLFNSYLKVIPFLLLKASPQTCSWNDQNRVKENDNLRVVCGILSMSKKAQKCFNYWGSRILISTIPRI